MGKISKMHTGPYPGGKIDQVHDDQLEVLKGFKNAGPPARYIDRKKKPVRQTYEAFKGPWDRGREEK